MIRIIWKNEIHDNQDLSNQDFTDAYLANCSFKGTKLGNCTNATFYQCDLTGADLFESILTGATFPFSILNNLKMVDTATAWQRKIGKNIASTVGFLPSHVNETYAYLCSEEAKTTTDPKLKAQLLEAAEDIKLHQGYCFKEFYALFNMKWPNDKTLFKTFLKLCQVDPRLSGRFKSELYEEYQKNYPTIKEEELTTPYTLASQEMR